MTYSCESTSVHCSSHKPVLVYTEAPVRGRPATMPASPSLPRLLCNKFLILLLFTQTPATWSKIKIPIGTIFSKAPDWVDVYDAMNLAMEGHTSSNSSVDFDMKFYVDNIDTIDAYKLTKIICKQVMT